MKKAWVGTSGFLYKGWHGLFYPPEVKKNYLAFYATKYRTVEINSTFYRLPEKSAFLKWHAATPPGFLFTVKLSRYITHIKRLKGVKRETRSFLTRAQGLQEKFGCLLIQLPPSLKFDSKIATKFFADLEAVTQELGLQMDIALEPRHRSWLEEGAAVRALCKRLGMALVFAQSSKYFSIPPEEINVTGSFIYLRFHGPGQFAASLYGPEKLAPWAALAKKWLKTKNVYAYFNNDIHGYAVQDAETLATLLKGALAKSK